MSTAKYDSQAERWRETAYADPRRYLRRRAELVVGLGTPLAPGDTVLDLACGDGAFAEELLPHGLVYLGVDANEPMVAAARRRLGSRASVELADLNEFRPREPVAATTCFRAIYYARDRRSFLRRVAGYTKKKLVFDVNPRRDSITAVAADLRAAGFDSIELRPFFVPQRVALSRPLAFVLELAEHGGPLSRLLLRFRFSYIVAASRAAFSDAQSH